MTTKKPTETEPEVTPTAAEQAEALTPTETADGYIWEPTVKVDGKFRVSGTTASGETATVDAETEKEGRRLIRAYHKSTATGGN